MSASPSLARSAGEGRGGGDLQRTVDHFQYRGRLIEDLVVPKPENAKTGCSNTLITLMIVCMLILMLSTIELHHQLRFEASEVRYVSGDRNLATEAVIRNVSATQVIPKVA